MANVKKGLLKPPPQLWKHLHRGAVKSQATDMLMLTQRDFEAFTSTVELPTNPSATLRKLMARQ